MQRHLGAKKHKEGIGGWKWRKRSKPLEVYGAWGSSYSNVKARTKFRWIRIGTTIGRPHIGSTVQRKYSHLQPPFQRLWIPRCDTLRKCFKSASWLCFLMMVEIPLLTNVLLLLIPTSLIPSWLFAATKPDCKHQFQTGNFMTADYIGSSADDEMLKSKDPLECWMSRIHHCLELSLYPLRHWPVSKCTPANHKRSTGKKASAILLF